MSCFGSSLCSPYAGQHLAAVFSQFRRQFDACRTRADNRHLDARLVRRALDDRVRRAMLRAHAGRDQPLAKEFSLPDRVERDRILLRARDAEEVRRAADGDDQRVVFELALRDQFAGFLVPQRPDRDALGRAIQPDEFALRELEAMPERLRCVFEFLRERVHAARRDLVQERLPDVSRVAVDQRDLSLRRLFRIGRTVPVPETRGQFEPAGPSADDDEAMH